MKNIWLILWTAWAAASIGLVASGVNYPWGKGQIVLFLVLCWLAGLSLARTKRKANRK